MPQRPPQQITELAWEQAWEATTAHPTMEV